MPSPRQSHSAYDDYSDSDEEEQQDSPAFMVMSEDPRTLSQIKRSRINLVKRYVFLCPLALSKHFEALPQQAKDAALLVLRCQRNMLFPDPPAVRRSRIEARVDCKREGADGYTQGGATSSTKGKLGAWHYRGEFGRDFLNWVLAKEQAGSVFWLKPEKDLQKLSKFLEDKRDPVSNAPYRPLLLDPQWWRVRFLRKGARFVANPSSVVAAITAEHGHGKELDALVLQELIYQSNPNLEPISKWPHAPSMRYLPRPGALHHDPTNETKYKGYVDQDRAMDGSLLPAVAREYSRIAHWPDHPRDRLDNLHRTWQTEVSSRHGTFAVHSLTAIHGLSTLGRPLTAR